MTSRLRLAAFRSGPYDVVMIARHHELIDGHIRLQHASFEGQRHAVMERAERAGVAACVCSSCRQDDWIRLLELAATESNLIPCYGIDPLGLSDRSDDWHEGLEHCLELGPGAVGMLGLDRSVRDVSLKEQEDLLVVQLRLAHKYQRPVLLRCRGQWPRLLSLLEDLDVHPPGLLLCGFHGPPRMVERFIRLGAYFLVTGDILTHRHSRAARLLKTLPLDRLVAGTDAPDALPPAPFAPYQIIDADRRAVNEPANLPHIVEGLAPHLALDLDVLAQLLHHNTLCLFGVLIPGDVEV